MAQLAFLAVLVFLLTTKVWSPQYSIWLVPLVALARPRWRLALLWQFSEIAVWITFMLYLLGLNDTSRGIELQLADVRPSSCATSLIILAGLVIREMWHPELDVVRSGGLDDPGGGPYDGSPDGPVTWRCLRSRLPPAEIQPADTRESLRNAMSSA